MSYKLLIDTSDKYLSVGIAKDLEVIYQNSFSAWQRQSELLIPEIVVALNYVKLDLEDISEIVVAKGPGSYTGVRIALTFAKTLGSVANVKVKTITSLACLGRSDECFVSVINAHSNRSYIACYENGKCLLKEQILSNEKVLEVIEKYRNQGFKLYGDTDYLNIKSDGEKIIEGLLTFSELVDFEDNILSLKPLYLKDAI